MILLRTFLCITPSTKRVARYVERTVLRGESRAVLDRFAVLEGVEPTMFGHPDVLALLENYRKNGC